MTNRENFRPMTGGGKFNITRHVGIKYRKSSRAFFRKKNDMPKKKINSHNKLTVTKTSVRIIIPSPDVSCKWFHVVVV